MPYRLEAASSWNLDDAADPRNRRRVEEELSLLTGSGVERPAVAVLDGVGSATDMLAVAVFGGPANDRHVVLGQRDEGDPFRVRHALRLGDYLHTRSVDPSTPSPAAQVMVTCAVGDPREAALRAARIFTRPPGLLAGGQPRVRLVSPGLRFDDALRRALREAAGPGVTLMLDDGSESDDGTVLHRRPWEGSAHRTARDMPDPGRPDGRPGRASGSMRQ